MALAVRRPPALDHKLLQPTPPLLRNQDITHNSTTDLSGMRSAFTPGM